MDMIKNSRLQHSQPEPHDTLEPLTDNEFFMASDRAYRSALRLASFCSGVTQESLNAKYRQWCKDEGFLEECPLLGDEDDFELEEAPQTGANQSETQSFFQALQIDASLEFVKILTFSDASEEQAADFDR